MDSVHWTPTDEAAFAVKDLEVKVYEFQVFVCFLFSKLVERRGYQYSIVSLGALSKSSWAKTKCLMCVSVLHLSNPFIVYPKTFSFYCIALQIYMRNKTQLVGQFWHGFLSWSNSLYVGRMGSERFWQEKCLHWAEGDGESSQCPWPVCFCCFCYCYYCSGYGQSQLTAARVMASDQRSEIFWPHTLLKKY